MSRQRNHGVEMVRLTSQDMERFHRCAPAALARRSGGFAGETLAHALEQVLVGGIPIVGMLAYGWSPSQLLIFLLVGMWIGIAADVVKLYALAPQAAKFVQSRLDDWHVWVVVTALRSGTREAPKAHLLGKNEMWLGVFIDFVCGGMGTALILLAVATDDSEQSISRLITDRGMLYGLAGLVAYQVAMAAWEISSHLSGRAAGRELKVTPGMRGIGMFFLMFLVVIVREHGGANAPVAWGVILAVNGLIVAFGLFNAVGLLWLRGETAWLREYLRTR